MPLRHTEQPPHPQVAMKETIRTPLKRPTHELTSPEQLW